MVKTSYNGKLVMSGYYTDTTDGSGDITITLADTPRDINAIMLFCNDEEVIPEVQSTSGTTLVVRFYTIKYDKPSTTVTDANNLPGGVTAQGAKQNTDSTGPGAAMGASAGGPNYSYVAHVHGVSHEYEHSHNVTGYSTTNAAGVAYTAQAVEVMVIYARNS